MPILNSIEGNAAYGSVRSEYAGIGEPLYHCLTWPGRSSNTILAMHGLGDGPQSYSDFADMNMLEFYGGD